MAKRLLIFCALFVSVFAANAVASGTFIPAANRIDIVHDFNRNLLYISNGNQILRYDIAANVFLTPFTLGQRLYGMDLSPDGDTLAVADLGQNFIFLVDLNTGTWRQPRFVPSFSEGGSFTVAFGNDGKLLVTTTFNGSGWVPLRRYDPATETYEVVLPSITQNTMAIASDDRSIIGLAESNISDGRWAVYNVGTGTIVERTGYADGTGWFNYEIGVNHDGTQFAIPTYGGTYLFDANYMRWGVIGTYAGPQPIGVVYHPVDDRVYFPWVGTTEVREYNSTTLVPLAAYNFEDTFTNQGNRAFVQGRMKISRDGSLLFATVTGGVRYVRLYASLTADNQAVITPQDTETPITLTGSIGNGGMLDFSIADPPLNGTLVGTAPNLGYVPAAGFTGTDSFTFRVSYGRATAAATVTVMVEPR